MCTELSVDSQAACVPLPWKTPSVPLGWCFHFGTQWSQIWIPPSPFLPKEMAISTISIGWSFTYTSHNTKNRCHRADHDVSCLIQSVVSRLDESMATWGTERDLSWTAKWCILSLQRYRLKRGRMGRVGWYAVSYIYSYPHGVTILRINQTSFQSVHQDQVWAPYVGSSPYYKWGGGENPNWLWPWLPIPTKPL